MAYFEGIDLGLALGAVGDAPQPEQGDFVRGAKVAFGQTMPLAKGVVGLVGATGEQAFGEGGIWSGVKNWGLSGYQEGMQKLAPLQKDTDELTTAWDRAKQGDIGALIDWAQYGLGYALGQAGEAVAAATLGGLVGSAAAPGLGTAAGGVSGLVAKGATKEAVTGLIRRAVLEEAQSIVAKSAGKTAAEEAVKTATKAVAGRIGQTGALLAFGGVQELGSIYPEAEAQAAAEGRQLGAADLARVWGMGLAAGAVEGLTDRLGIDAALGRIKLPVGGRVAGAGLGLTAGATVEGGTEAVQTYLERVGAGQETTGDEATRDYINSAGLGALGGAAIGGVTGAAQGHRAMKRLAESETVDDAIAAAGDLANGPDIAALAGLKQAPIPALPAPVRATDWEVVDGTRALPAPVRAEEVPAVPLLPAPVEAVLMADAQGNVAPQPAAQRAEAITRETEHQLAIDAERGRYQAARAEKAAVGLTPDVEQAQLQREISQQEPRTFQTQSGAAVEARRSGGVVEPVPGGGFRVVQPLKPDDLLTADGMPYGTRASAAARATKEGGVVVQVPGGFVVRKDPDAQPDLRPTPVVADGAAGAGRAEPARSRGDLGLLATDAGERVPEPAGAPVSGVPAAAVVDDGQRGDDAALTAVTEDDHLAAKRSMWQAYSATGAPDDVVARSVQHAQEKADSSGSPMTLWRGPSGTLGLVPADQASPLKGGVKVATLYPSSLVGSTSARPMNVDEVPDRSPGFVRSQKAVIAERNEPNSAPVPTPETPAPTDQARAAEAGDGAAGTPAVAAARRAAVEADGLIQDLGEKIGGARKDTAVSTGPRAGAAKQDTDPGWRKRYEVAQVAKSSRPEEEGRWTLRDLRTKDFLGQPKQVGRESFATREEAEAAIPLVEVARNHRAVSRTEDGKTYYEITRDVSDRKRVTVVPQRFETRQDAMTYMVQHATEIIETKTSFGEEILPRPETVDRVGAERRQGDVAGKDFMSVFGFRGVEFGNWNSQDERQQVMNHAYDALLDLAEVMKVPPKALSLGGQLALAFGARGHGLRGARAHYETDYGVINLTKMHGAGSLAHEWFHALDHHFGRQDGKAGSERVANERGDMVFKARGPEADLASHGFYKGGVRPELAQEYTALIQTMFKKAEAYVEDTQKADRFVAEARRDLADQLQSLRQDLAEQKNPQYYKRNNKPATAEQLAEFDRIAQSLIDGEMLETEHRLIPSTKQKLFGLSMRWTNDALERLNAIYKAVRGRSGFDATNHNGLLDSLGGTMKRYSARLHMLADAQQSTEKQRQVPTDFVMEAKSIDQGRASDYWATPHEMAARAFQAYVEDKLAAQGGKSDFLSYGTNTAVLTPWGWKRPFPKGEERQAIDAAFDRFVGELKTREDEAGNVVMFSRSGDPEARNALKALSENDELYALPKSDKTTVEGIAADIDPEIKITPRNIPGEQRYDLTMPDGNTARLVVRRPNPYGPTLYSYDLVDGEMTNLVTELPGENAEAVDGKEQVYIDVSLSKPGEYGGAVYQIAETYANNTGRLFIGDPNGFSNDAMRRRPEQMLSSALKFGTTEHLAPHPKQLAGNPKIGIPPLRWVHGDDIGNIRRLVDLNLKALENAGYDDALISFDAGSGQFRDSSGAEISRADIDALAKATNLGGRGLAGGRTLARGAVLRALLREESRAGSTGRGRDGLLARLAKLASDAPQATQGIFYNRGPGLTRGMGLERAQAFAKKFTDLGLNRINVAESIDDLPDPQRQKLLAKHIEGGIRGAYFPDTGEVWVFTSQVRNEDEFAFVALHESFHRGLRAVIGPEAEVVLGSIYATNSKVRRLADAQMQLHGIEKAEAIEEALADLAGQGDISDLRLFGRLIALVKRWLVQASEKLGIKIRWTDAMVQEFVTGIYRAGMREDPTAFVGEVRASRRGAEMVGIPRAIIGTTLGQATSHPMYDAAKAGDRSAAFTLARDLVKDGLVDEVRAAIGDTKPFVVPVASVEAAGRNKIPLAVASVLADKIGLEVAHGIVQSTSPKRTGLDGLSRLFNSPEFDGPVQSGASYLLVDDTLTQGGTFAALASHIRQGGGNVIGSVALTGKRYSATISLSPDLLAQVRERYPDVEDSFRAATGYGFDALTESEARYLVKHDSPESVRDRILAAGNEAGRRLDEGGTGEEQVRLSRAHTLPDFATTPELKSAAAKIDTYAPRESIQEKVKGLTQNWKERLIQGVVDAYAPLKKLGMDAYVAARMVKAADGAFEGLLLYGRPKMDADGALSGELDGKGFLGVLRELNGEHDRFMMWVAGNRAARLAGEGREHLFTAAEIDGMKRLNEGDMKDGRSRSLAYAKALKEFNGYSKSVLDIAEQSGLIDGESRSTWEHDFYVPFYRLAPDDTIAGPGRIKGLVRQQAFKKLQGGTEPLGDLLENTMRNWSHLISASLANRAAGLSLVAAEKAGVAVEAKESTAKDMAKSVGKKGGAVYFMDQGRERWFVVGDEGVLAAITSMEAVGLSGLPMKLMSRFKHFLTLGVTIAPAFKLRNLIRDTIAAPAVNDMSFNVLSNVAEGWKGTAKTSEQYRQMLFGGALMRFGTYLEGDRAEHVKRLINDGVADDTILDTPAKIKSALGKVWDGWQDFGDRLENVNRAALYEQQRAQGKSHLEASFAARDMMDFSLQGSWAAMRILTQVVPFLNARAQGLYKLGRGAKQDPKRFGYVTGAVALASLALLLAYEDDEDWKAREDWDRDNFWWFKVGDVAYRIPKPFEIGALGTIAERSAELMISQEMTGRRFADRLKQMLLDTFAMNPIPQAFKPMIDLYANKNSFTGRDIETLGMERHSKAERYGPNTSIIARMLGSAGDYTGLSPVQIDHLVRGYFGWLGGFAVSTVDMAARPFGDVEKPAMKLDDFMMGFGKELPQAQSRYVTEFYHQNRAVSEFMADLKRARDIGDFERARELLDDNRDKLALHRLYAKAEQQMSLYGQQIRRVQASDLDADAKRAAIDRWTTAKNDLARRVRSLQTPGP